MRSIGFIGVALALAAGIYSVQRGWTHDVKAPVDQSGAPPEPGLHSHSRPVFAAGTVEGARREAALRFEIAGRLSALHVHEGDHVEAGDVLAELEAESFELGILEAEARLNLARAERERLIHGASPESRNVLKSDVLTAEVHVREAESQLARAQQLSQRNSMSTQELDEFRYKYEAASARLQAIRARWEEVDAPARQDDLSIADAKVALAEAVARQERNTLEKTRLRAPVGGIVLHIVAEPGELVGPADVRHVVTVVNREVTRVRAYVEELDALCVRVGQKALVTAEGRPDQPYEGNVRFCAPHVRPKSVRDYKPGEMLDLRVREVVIELSCASDLVVGLPVDVFIDRNDPVAERAAEPDNVAR